METQLVILGCLIALIACLAIRVQTMSSEICWIRSKLLAHDGGYTPDDDEYAPDTIVGHNRRQASDSSRSAKAATYDQGAGVGDPRQMVASILGTAMPKALMSAAPGEDDIRDNFDEIDDDFGDDRQDATAVEHMRQLAFLQLTRQPVYDTDDGDERRITEVSPEASDLHAAEDVDERVSSSDDDDDVSSIELEDEAPPE